MRLLNHLVPRLVIACYTCLSYANGSYADDWPHWLGLNRDATWNETDIIERFPEGGPTVAWRIPVNQGYTGPAVANGHVYLMDFSKDADEEQLLNPAGRREGVRGVERVLCVKEDDGELVWQHELERTYAMSYPQGPRTTPTVDEGKLYTLGAMGDLACFDAQSGKSHWAINLPDKYNAKVPMWGYSAHPLIDGERIFVTVGGEGSAIVALNKITGEEIWRFGSVEEIGYSPPVIHEADRVRRLLVWFDAKIHSLDLKTGQPHWSFDFPDGKVSRPVVNIVTPRVFDSNQLFVSNFYDGSLLLEIDKSGNRARRLWAAEPGPAHRDGLNALLATPLIKNGHIYGVAGKGQLRCLDTMTGKLKWEDVTPTGKRPQTFASCFIVENQGRFFILNDQGDLIIANMSAAGYDELDRVKIIDPSGSARGRSIVWSHPAFANGHMFARNDLELIRVRLRKAI